MEQRMRIYIAGPMRGLPLFNFPAFDAAAKKLRAMGHEVVSPAELDRAVGFDPATSVPDDAFMRRALARDLVAVTECDAIALLHGWQNSQGTRLELSLARMLGLKVLDANTGEPPHESILLEALRLTRGNRNADYGHPLDDFTRTAALWSAFLGTPVDYRQAIVCMMLVKVSRLGHTPEHHDSIVDLAGYADCLAMAIGEDKARLTNTTEAA